MGLLHSVPRLDRPRKEKLNPIEGQPPDLINLPSGCAFRVRCRYVVDRCAQEFPPFVAVGDGHYSACWVAEELEGRRWRKKPQPFPTITFFWKFAV